MKKAERKQRLRNQIEYYEQLKRLGALLKGDQIWLDSYRKELIVTEEAQAEKKGKYNAK